MTTTIDYLITDDRVTIIMDGRFRSFSMSTDQGQTIADLLQAVPQDHEAIREAADIRLFIERKSFGRVAIDTDDIVRLDGEPVDYGVAQTLLHYYGRGADCTAIVKYIERVSLNPSEGIANDLYRFLKQGNLPLTPEGKIRAFKGVREDFLSFHRGSEEVEVLDGDTIEMHVGHIPHVPGTILRMRREDCNLDRSNSCGKGLHACSVEYLKAFYNRAAAYLIVEIDPADVTAIPDHSKDQKLRCHTLAVICQIEQEDIDRFFEDLAVDRRRFESGKQVEESQTTLAEALDPDQAEVARHEFMGAPIQIFGVDVEIPVVAAETAAHTYTPVARSADVVTDPVDHVGDDADTDLPLTDEQQQHYFDLGFAVGKDDGEGDAENGAPCNPLCPDDLQQMPEGEEALEAFMEGYREGYCAAYPPEVEETDDGIIDAAFEEVGLDEGIFDTEAEDVELGEGMKDAISETASGVAEALLEKPQKMGMDDGRAEAQKHIRAGMHPHCAPADHPHFTEFSGDIQRVYAWSFTMGYMGTFAAAHSEEVN